MASPTFGSKVVGEEAYLRAVEEHKGGLDVFGTRVRDQIPDSHPDNQAKRNSEFGPKTVDGAKFTNPAGSAAPTGLAVTEIKRILGENPTFFDSLYEAELARPGGPRKDALHIFAEVERGTKGQMRGFILDEINGFLGKIPAGTGAHARQIMRRANLDRGEEIPDHLQTDEERQAAADAASENEGEEFEEDAGEVTAPTQGAATTNRATAAVEPGVQTQATGSTPVEGSGDTRYSSMNKAELEEEVAARGIEPTEVKASGADGAVLVADLVTALKENDRRRAEQEQQ
jgi:hypothetical protein